MINIIRLNVVHATFRENIHRLQYLPHHRCIHAGCSDSPDSAASAKSCAPNNGGPLYAAGDIIRSASGSESPAWLVISYDSASDSYPRALISRKPMDRMVTGVSPKTESSKRTVMEKVFTVKITTWRSVGTDRSTDYHYNGRNNGRNHNNDNNVSYCDNNNDNIHWPGLRSRR